MTVTATPIPDDRHKRFLREAEHHARPFGSGPFGQKAEAFARFFGTPTFLVGQTVVVGCWIALNSIGVVHFDLYPFILLDLAFSLRAAYAAPLILLAQTRQADRDKAHAEADAKHREAVAAQSLDRQQLAAEGIQLLHRLLDENRARTRRVEALTEEIHGKVSSAWHPAPFSRVAHEASRAAIQVNGWSAPVGVMCSSRNVSTTVKASPSSAVRSSAEYRATGSPEQ